MIMDMFHLRQTHITHIIMLPNVGDDGTAMKEGN